MSDEPICYIILGMADAEKLLVVLDKSHDASEALAPVLGPGYADAAAELAPSRDAVREAIERAR